MFGGAFLQTLLTAAPIASAMFSFFGLVFVGIQIRSAAKTADLQALINVSKDTMERESALLLASRGGDEGAWEGAFYQFVNHLETLAACYQEGLFRKVTAGMAKDVIADAMAVIEVDPRWASKVAEAKTFETTHRYLTAFVRRHRHLIDKQKTKLLSNLSGRPQEPKSTGPATALPAP